MTSHQHGRPGGTRLAGILVFLIAANLLAWVWAFSAFAAQPALLGMAALAYLYGLRHALDADHIAAIDNVVRKLMHDGQRPYAVGLFFSLGHSSIVLLAVAAIALAASQFKAGLGSFEVVGAGVSAGFLLIMAALNLHTLKALWMRFQRLKLGEAPPDAPLPGSGLLARLLRPLLRLVSRSWHLFPIGLLFGLGFDTATTIGLLSISASHAADAVSPLTLMLFPLLFTVGMALVDTLDSALMVGAYGWALDHPLRKLWYNLSITAVSALLALLIGLLGALALLAEQLQLTGAAWSWLAALNDSLADFGYLIAAVFLACWALSAGIYKWRGYELRYGKTQDAR